MAPPRTFDPKKVIVTFGGAQISGYADGTFISIERNSDTFETVSGADGAVSRAKINDKTGTLTLTLKQTSPSNAILSALHKVDEDTGNGVVPCTIKDLSGDTEHISAFAWVQKPATWEAGKTINNTPWVIALAEYEPNIGGNFPSGLTP